VSPHGFREQAKCFLKGFHSNKSEQHKYLKRFFEWFAFLSTGSKAHSTPVPDERSDGEDLRRSDVPHNASRYFVHHHTVRSARVLDFHRILPVRIARFSPNSTWRVTSWHDTLPTNAFWRREKWRGERCHVCRTARCDTLVTRTRRVYERRHSAWTGVDMSTALFFREVVPETDANPEHKRLNLYTRALLLRRRPPCWNKHGSTHRTCRIETWRDEPSGIWALLKENANSLILGRFSEHTLLNQKVSK